MRVTHAEINALKASIEKLINKCRDGANHTEQLAINYLSQMYKSADRVGDMITSHQRQKMEGK